MHCLIVWGQGALELLQNTASLPGGSGQWNSCNALPHCLGAVGSATPAIHCLTAWGQWAIELLQCTTFLPGGSGQCNSCNTPPNCLRAVGSGNPAMHCRTARGQWALQLLQCTITPPGGGGREILQCAGPQAGGTGSPAHEAVAAQRLDLPQCTASPLGALGSAIPAVHCHTAWGQWVVELLQRTATLPGGSGQWNSCNALPRCLGVVGTGTPAMHCLTAGGQWAVHPVQCTATPPGHGGQWNSCNPRAHQLGGRGALPRRWSQP